MSAVANAAGGRDRVIVRPSAAVGLLAVGAALWTAAYAVVYVLVAQHQDDTVAWWYVAVLAVCALVVVVAPCTRARLVLLIAAGAVLFGCALLGLLSVGLLLIPAVGLVALAAALRRSPTPHTTSR